MVKIANQLDKKILPVYSDEAVFRILIDIYLQRQNQFKALIFMLENFHTSKCLEHCIRRYTEKTGITDCLSVGFKAVKDKDH